MSKAAPAGGTGSTLGGRWLQLVAGILAMVAVANFQYGWTLFVDPIAQRFHWERAMVQNAFTLFVLAQTWLVPFETYLVDRYGPRLLVLAGGALVALAWAVDSTARELWAFYVGGVLSGIGAGIVYGTAMGNALKWFPDRRGLAAGLTAAAFGAGAALTVAPMFSMIRQHGYQTTFLVFGLAQGAVVLLMALVLRAPDPGLAIAASRTVRQARRDCAPLETVRTPVFWVMYAMMTMATIGGLMIIAQIAPMADDFKVADRPVHILGITMAALPFALSLDRVLNGLTRPFFGWISDHVGRENTMFIAFGLEGFAILLLISLAHVPVLFVVLTGLTFFAWGEIYSLFPALSADLFGRKFAATNYGLLYTAKGTASLLVPLGNYLHQRTGSWAAIFIVAIAFDWLAALLALVALKPLCRRWLAAQEQVEGGAGREIEFAAAGAA